MESQECCFQRNHLMMRILLGQSHTGRIPSYSTTNLHHIWVHTYVMSYEFYIRWKVSSWGCAACQNKGKVGGICAICISHRGEGLTTGQELQNRGKISARQALLHFGAQTDTSSAPKILALRHFWCTDRYSEHQVHQNICLAQWKYQKYQQISQLTKVAICCQKLLFVAKSCHLLQKVTICCQRFLFQSVTFMKILIRMNVRIYSYQQTHTNEYPNIFILIFLTRTNVQISIRIENCTNIRIYSNIRLGFTL